MPITLGCPSCGKRFRARDESAGKKVKCPYCQSAVQVPTPEESAAAGAPTAALPSTTPAPAPVIATAADWGTAAPAPPAPPPPPEPKLEPEPSRAPLPVARAEEPKARARPAKDWSWGADETPEKVLAAGWKRVRRGLFWVQFALLWLMLAGFVEVGKTLYERQVGPLPHGDGAEWISIDGFVNTGGPNAIPLRKEEIIDLAAYGIPAALAALLATYGRLVASGAPRRSGAGGLFALSSLGTLLAFVALAASVMFERAFPDYAKVGADAFVTLLPLAEFWFVVALAACGVALRRPGTVSTVGFLGFVLGALVAFRTFGWSHVERELRALPGPDKRLAAQAAFAAGWFLLLASYWLAIRVVRRTAREFIEAATDRT
jgi:phage FluMu protein Com